MGRAMAAKSIRLKISRHYESDRTVEGLSNGLVELNTLLIPRPLPLRLASISVN